MHKKLDRPIGDQIPLQFHIGCHSDCGSAVDPQKPGDLSPGCRLDQEALRRGQDTPVVTGNNAKDCQAPQAEILWRQTSGSERFSGTATQRDPARRRGSEEQEELQGTSWFYHDLINPFVID